jgi:hypothetical protein
VKQRIGVLVFFFLCPSLISQAQSPTAVVNGQVRDTSGAAVPNASVEVINDATSARYTTETNDEGIYSLPNLPPGTYHIRVSKIGFKAVVHPEITLNVQDAKAIGITLPVGPISDTVTVEGGAPLIETESAAVSTVVDRQFAENLPLNGRSFQTLIALTPGTVVTKASFSEQGQFSVNGQRANANYFTVDGVSANAGVSAGNSLAQSAGGALPAFSAAGGTSSLVSVDALQEFRIQTSTFAPEFGRTPGAQVSIVTRSGTNRFSGTLFEYFRNDVLDANDWFANANRLPKAALRQNDFGGVLGGPILKDKTFFFFSYEGLRLRLPQTAITSVPSMAVRQAAPTQIQPFLNAYPVPNGAVFANGFAGFAATYSDPSSLNATSIRVDHSINPKVTLFGRYNYAPSETTQRGAASSAVNVLGDTKFTTQTATVGSTQSLTSGINNEFRGNYSKSEGGNFFRLDSLGGAVPPLDTVVFPSFAAPQDSLFALSITGGQALRTGKNANNVQRQFNLVDSLSIVTGGHQVKFGVDYRWLSPISGPRAYNQAARFSGLGVTPPGTPAPSGSVLSGKAQMVTVNAQEEVALVIHNLSIYGQDTWRATERLSLTYGLRWELNPAPTGKNGKDLFTFQSLDNLAALTVAPRGTSLYETTYNNFAPRIGLAYQLNQKHGRELVLRGGSGIFYDLGLGSLGIAAASFPYFSSKLLRSVPFPLSPTDAAPPPFSLTSFPPGGTAYVSDRHLKLPRTYQWNVSAEQSLGANQTLSASYVGAAGRRLLIQDFLITPGSFFVDLTRNTGMSNYNALQLQLQRRLSRGLQALASYTWSHSIDNASNDSFSNTPGRLGGPGIDRGSSDFDVRHVFTGAASYNIPAPAVGAVGKAFLGNWAIESIVTSRSATPVTIFSGFDFSGGSEALIRPDVMPGVPLYLYGSQYPGGKAINNTPGIVQGGCSNGSQSVGPFCPPPVDANGNPIRQGNLGRNALRGFSATQWDFAVHRDFPIRESLRLQFRAELFNVLNHPNFGDPGNLQGNFLPSPSFGLSTSMLGRSLGSGGFNGGFNPLYQTGGPRSIQLSLKVQF